MKVDVNYFGVIAEKINCKQEQLVFAFNEESKIDLRAFFIAKYPIIETLKFKIAINKQFSEVLTESIDTTEIAILPPFAGG